LEKGGHSSGAAEGRRTNVRTDEENDPMIRKATPRIDRVMKTGAADVLLYKLRASETLVAPVVLDALVANICWT